MFISAKPYMKYRKRERCLACYGQIKYLNTLTRHLRTIHKLSRKEYNLKCKEETYFQCSSPIEKCKEDTVESNGASLLEVNSSRKVIPLDVLAHDKRNERIHVHYSDGDIIWVPTSLLLRDDELRERFTFFHACEKTFTKICHSY